MDAQRTDGLRERWMPGESAWFEYHCLESHDSADADLWVQVAPARHGGRDGAQ